MLKFTDHEDAHPAPRTRHEHNSCGSSFPVPLLNLLTRLVYASSHHEFTALEPARGHSRHALF